ncbi:hypothetical protein AB0873_14820 [Micromonospora sp. NPDC047707]|uniref:hypothetical protein n=1 Tax=Micromonospora sp. NPDC047707 TaxID=3154498 RepID=UPI003455A96A
MSDPSSVAGEQAARWYDNADIWGPEPVPGTRGPSRAAGGRRFALTLVAIAVWAVALGVLFAVAYVLLAHVDESTVTNRMGLGGVAASQDMDGGHDPSPARDPRISHPAPSERTE